MSALRFVGRYLEELVACVCLVLMCLAAFANVVARYAANSPITWAEELARYAFIWLVFVGAAVCTKRNSHIAVDVVVAALPKLGQPYCRLLADFGTATLMVILIWYGTILAKAATQPTSTLGIPTYIIYAIVPICALSILLRTLIKLARDVRAVRAREPS